VRAPDSTVTAHELFEHCLTSLAKFKVPRYIDFWDEFPRTSTLKISRGDLNSDPDLWADRYQQM
jgi:acyl-CoA synthetase (AMP-forming)/AMP-acid ligase II